MLITQRSAKAKIMNVNICCSVIQFHLRHLSFQKFQLNLVGQFMPSQLMWCMGILRNYWSRKIYEHCAQTPKFEQFLWFFDAFWWMIALRSRRFYRLSVISAPKIYAKLFNSIMHFVVLISIRRVSLFSSFSHPLSRYLANVVFTNRKTFHSQCATIRSISSCNTLPNG